MKESIYGLLNEIETDFTEYEEMELSSQEKEKHKQRILMEVSSMKNRKKKEGKVWKIAAGAAAACVITVGAVGLSNPVLAKELFSDVFGKLIENTKGEKYEKEDTERYTKIGESAVAVQEEVEKRQGEEGYITTTENNGVKISVSDIYCDGYVLYFTSSLQTDNDGLNKADGIGTILDKGDWQAEALTVEGMDTSGWATKAFEKSEDGSFVTVNQINLMNATDENNADFVVDENGTIVVDWKINKLTGKLWDAWDDQGEYQTTGMVEGDWHLRFPVTVDKSLNEVFDINKEENGVLVKRGIKTKAGLVLEVALPDFRKEPYNDKYNDPDTGIKNSEGNYLQCLSMKSDIHEDGISIMQVMVLYNGEKDLSFEVTTRDEYQNQIAKIDFQVP